MDELNYAENAGVDYQSWERLHERIYAQRKCALTTALFSALRKSYVLLSLGVRREYGRTGAKRFKRGLLHDLSTARRNGRQIVVLVSLLEYAGPYCYLP